MSFHFPLLRRFGGLPLLCLGAEGGIRPKLKKKLARQSVLCVYTLAFARTCRAVARGPQEGQDIRCGRRGREAPAQQEGLAGPRRDRSAQGGGPGFRHSMEVRFCCRQRVLPADGVVSCCVVSSVRTVSYLTKKMGCVGDSKTVKMGVFLSWVFVATRPPHTATHSISTPRQRVVAIISTKNNGIISTLASSRVPTTSCVIGPRELGTVFRGVEITPHVVVGHLDIACPLAPQSVSFH